MNMWQELSFVWNVSASAALFMTARAMHKAHIWARRAAYACERQAGRISSKGVPYYQARGGDVVKLKWEYV